jgi:hypothetical protein
MRHCKEKRHGLAPRHARFSAEAYGMTRPSMRKSIHAVVVWGCPLMRKGWNSLSDSEVELLLGRIVDDGAARARTSATGERATGGESQWDGRRPSDSTA